MCRIAISALWVLGALIPLAASAGQSDASEAERAAQAIERALQRHAGDVHRCFEKALADRIDIYGRLEVEVEVGASGKVTSVKTPSAGQETSPELSRCVQKAALAWTLEGIEPGSTVVLPFSFQPQLNQFVVKVADAPDRVLGKGATTAKAKPGPQREAPFTVKVLADQANVRAQQISLTQLSIGPASRVAMHRHPRSDKVLYLMRGHARLLGPAGVAPLKLDEGMAAFIPAGYPHVIENMGRQSTAVFLQAFAPPGPERVYRDPADPAARADFEVLRDPAGAKVPPESNGRLVVTDPSNVAALPILAGKGTSKVLIDPANTNSQAISANLLELNPGAEMTRHSHEGTSEILFVVTGGGKLTVGSEVFNFGADEMIYLPSRQPHSLQFTSAERTEKIYVVQMFAPGLAQGRAPTAAPAHGGAR